jgi:hypothetical protein
MLLALVILLASQHNFSLVAGNRVIKTIGTYSKQYNLRRPFLNVFGGPLMHNVLLAMQFVITYRITFIAIAFTLFSLCDLFTWITHRTKDYDFHE